MKLNQSVKKAIAILRAASLDAGGETASSLARGAGLPWTTAVRLIRTLEEEGFLTRLPDSDRYVLGFELIRLGRAGDQSLLLKSAALPELRRLTEELEETVTLTVVHPDGRLEDVEQIDPPRLIAPVRYTGQPYPLHASSLGKLLLASYDEARLDEFLAAPLPSYTRATITHPDALRAEIAQVRGDRYSVAVDELEDGLAALAVGLADADGKLVAMVSVSGPSFRFDEAARAAALEPVREAAGAIERRVAGRERAALRG